MIGRYVEMKNKRKSIHKILLVLAALIVIYIGKIFMISGLLVQWIRSAGRMWLSSLAQLYMMTSPLRCTETAIIVSDPLHMKRAMLLAEDAGIKAYSSPTPSTRYVSLRTKIPFLARETFYYIGYQWYRLFF